MDNTQPMIVRIMEEMLNRCESGFYIYMAPDNTVYKRVSPSDGSDRDKGLELLDTVRHQLIDIRSDLLRLLTGEKPNIHCTKKLEKPSISASEVDLELCTFKELMDWWWSTLDTMGYDEAGKNTMFAGSVRSSSLQDVVGMDMDVYEISLIAEVSDPGHRHELMQIILKEVKSTLGISP